MIDVDDSKFTLVNDRKRAVDSESIVMKSNRSSKIRDVGASLNVPDAKSTSPGFNKRQSCRTERKKERKSVTVDFPI